MAVNSSAPPVTSDPAAAFKKGLKIQRRWIWVHYNIPSLLCPQVAVMNTVGPPKDFLISAWPFFPEMLQLPISECYLDP